MKNLLKRKQIVLASIGGALLVLIMLVGILFIAPTMASASSNQGATATPSTATKVNSCELYTQNLAKKLNVSVTTLTQGNKSVLIDAINQRVKDGKLKQVNATKLIQRVNKSAGNVCPRQLQLVHRHVWLNKYAQDITNLLAQGLHLNASQLEAQFKAGKICKRLLKHKTSQLAHYEHS